MINVDDKTGEIFLYEAIGPAWAGMISDADFAKALQGFADRPVTLRINSPGGDAFMSTAMRTLLSRHRHQVSITIDGLAASGATHLLKKEFDVRASPGAMIMIHNAWTFTGGNSKALGKAVELLDKIDQAQVEYYITRMDATAEQIADMMEAETWFTAPEALEIGLIDGIDDELPTVEARVPAGMFNKTPPALLVSTEAEAKPAPIRRLAALGRLVKHKALRRK